MYVCMYVHNGFTIEIYGFMHSLRTSLARATHDAIVMEVEIENSSFAISSDCALHEAHDAHVYT